MELRNARRCGKCSVGNLSVKLTGSCVNCSSNLRANEFYSNLHVEKTIDPTKCGAETLFTK